ncbi:MAG: class I SAM-dependent methyltransferase [Verrucomicrobiales bacterium]
MAQARMEPGSWGEARANGSLADDIRCEIASSGPIRFSRYMELCLYHPQYGFYTRRKGRLGREGDFFTSVSVGPVFGQLLADYIVQQWERQGRPKPFSLIEQGAHDGRLAADILDELSRMAPVLFETLSYIIIEPLSTLEVWQRDQLAPWGSRVRWVRWPYTLSEDPVTGVFFANELLDSFPVDRFRFNEDHWHELLVGLQPDGAMGWIDGDVVDRADTNNPAMPFPRLDRSTQFPPGYTTEFCSVIRPWLVSAAATLSQGAVLIIDYGREAEDYYAPHRTEGTLRGYRAHQRCDDPFSAPGETDITADVNFTEVIDAAREISLDSRPLERQEAFLTRLARDRLREITEPPTTPEARQWLRQFQTLTHPGIMGSSFRVLELEK